MVLIALTYFIRSGWTAVTLISVFVILIMGLHIYFVERDFYVIDKNFIAAYMSSGEEDAAWRRK